MAPFGENLAPFTPVTHISPKTGTISAIAFGPFYAKPELLIGFVVAVAATLALRVMLKATYFGKAVRATVQDGEAAKLMGIPVPRIFLITFAMRVGAGRDSPPA